MLPVIMRSEQENFWTGAFGDEYTDRNASGLESNISLFARILARAPNIKTIFELGTNRGLNLDALATLLPHAERFGIEINDYAANIARRRHPNIVSGSITDESFKIEREFDLVFTKTVLIHITPDKLQEIYKQIARIAHRYVLMVEYYNPSPIEVIYRGHEGKLFKRDFAGEFMDTNDFSLVDYGFVYHRDPVFRADDITWFLMAKQTS